MLKIMKVRIFFIILLSFSALPLQPVLAKVEPYLLSPEWSLKRDIGSVIQKQSKA